ncbi:MAG: hypothetical protein ACREIT_05620, partial [Tepidisphaeraceae bacterium]
MGVACFGIQQMPGWPRGETKLTWAMQLLALITTGGAVYFGACAAMGINVLRHVLPRRSQRLNAV